MSWRLHQFDDVASTMDVARAFAQLGAPDRTVVLAATQSAGRGQGSHTWQSPRGSLYASLLLRPATPPAQLWRYTLLAALAVADVVDALLPQHTAQTGIKWLNDIEVGGRKIAGVLVESALQGEQIDHLVIGVGLNLVPVAATFGDGANPTSVQDLGGPVCTPGDVVRLLLTAWDARSALAQDDAAALLRAYRARLTTLGRWVRLDGADGPRAQVTGLSNDGALQLTTVEGRAMIHRGRIQLLQSAPAD
jgi:BirA family transcriptional regulator, biotin operon repressor / biotin---[acetyl-CoA-carboxylase] ligase